MRSNGSVGGTRVYIFDCQNCRNGNSGLFYLSGATWCSFLTSTFFRPHFSWDWRRPRRWARSTCWPSAAAMIGGWRRTLACGIGSITGDLILFSLVLLGGHYLLSDLSNPTLRTVLAGIGVIVLLPLGIYFLIRAVKEPLRAYTSARKDWDEGTVPAHLATDVASCAALTMFNPLTMIYWVGVTANWLPLAHSILGSKAPGWGILMVAAGLMTWFTTLIVVVRFLPHRIGPTFFRLVNAHPRPDPPRLRHVLRNSSVPPFPWLKLLFHDPGRESFSQADEFIGWIRL